MCTSLLPKTLETVRLRFRVVVNPITKKLGIGTCQSQKWRVVLGTEEQGDGLTVILKLLQAL